MTTHTFEVETAEEAASSFADAHARNHEPQCSRLAGMATVVPEELAAPV